MHIGHFEQSQRRSVHRFGAAALVVSLALALLPAAPEHAAADQLFVLEGGGYGHSVGLSQFGAYGMALQGHTAEEILTHYYTGTTVEPVDPAVLASPLWVNLSSERASLSLTTIGTGHGPAVPVRYTQAGSSLQAGPGETATIDRLADGTCRIQTPQGTLVGSCTIDVEWDGREPEPATAVVLGGCSLPNWNNPSGTVYQPCAYARGGLRIRPDDNSNTVQLSVEIDIESYVLGISESPYFWGSSGGMEALRAQAIAARTYALRKAYDRGDPAGRPWCACNLYDTTVDQFYVGWGHGTDEWVEAATSTVGLVVTHPSTIQDGVQRPIEAFYSSSTFGWTEHSEHGFSAYLPYLRGVDDHWSQLPEVGNHSARWTVELSGAQLADRLPGLSTVTGVEVAACSPSGAILELTFRGSGGPKTFRTSELRTRLGIKSMQIYNVGAPPPAELPCPGPGTDPLPPGGPVSVSGIRIDDDMHEDSRGDGDGIAEPGEIIELYVALGNEGDSVSGIDAGLDSPDPAITVLWNERSAYPALAPGATEENQEDWDIAIAETASGTVILEMTVTAANGGPWTVDVPLTIGTSVDVPGGRATGIVSLGDVGGGLGEDVAVTYESASGAPRLRVLDPITGTTISDVQIGAKDLAVADLEPVPGTSEVAVLLVSPGTPAVVRIHDAATGERTGTRRFGGARQIAWSHLVVVPAGTPDGGTALGVFGVAATGGRRVVVKSAETPERISVLRVARHTDVADLVRLTDRSGDGTPDVAVIGRRSFGSDVALVFDPVTGSQVASVPLPARDATALAAPLGDDRLVAVSVGADGRAQVATVDPASGEAGTELPLELWEPTSLAVLPSGHGIAVLGRGADGTPAALVVDPTTGALLSTQHLPGGTPVGLAAPDGDRPGTPTVASLIELEAAASIEVRDAFTGVAVRSIPVA